MNGGLREAARGKIACPVFCGVGDRWASPKMSAEDAKATNKRIFTNRGGDARGVGGKSPQAAPTANRVAPLPRIAPFLYAVSGEAVRKRPAPPFGNAGHKTGNNLLSHPSGGGTTIGGCGLNERVRDGYVCFPTPMVTRAEASDPAGYCDHRIVRGK